MDKIIIFTLSCWLLLPPYVKAQSIVETSHNLSALSSETGRIGVDSEICKYCHTPHTDAPASPLWSQGRTGPNYILYNSSTLQAIPGQPDGSSILCLSCHDGTIAQGKLTGSNTDLDFSTGIAARISERSNLTTDLSDDHPISFYYTPTLATTDGQLKDPSTISMPVQLENGKVQCVSCHDPHKNPFTKYLVASNQFSDLCTSCHDRSFWPSSSHSTSAATWSGSGSDPWEHIEFPYQTVAENACENCHDPHNSKGKPFLLKSSSEESNCLDCHSGGNVANTDILTQTLKTYSHNVFGYNQIHNPTETAMPPALHVECQDCHNPHATSNISALAPAANGFIMGVQGIDQGGNTVTAITNEYELCYRCHTDNPAKPNSPTARQIEQDNVRLEFDLANPSFHPIEGVGANSNVPSLIAPLTESSIIYCTDCHASDGFGSPKGPHGSIYPRILKYRYETDDLTPESATNYELCYSCHSQASILSDVSFNGHSKHVRDEKTPCNACHDPHGVSATQGNSINNSHLINFDLRIVTPDNSGRLRYENTGNNTGTCYLNCHGKQHSPLGYQ